MNANERRVIHSTLQGMRGITTYSMGNEPNRRVVVALAGSRGPRNRGPQRGGERAERGVTEPPKAADIPAVAAIPERG